MESPKQNPVYVVLGATGGIGSATCRLLAKEGARLILAGRSTDKLNALAHELNATSVVLDATRFEEVEACFKQALEENGSVDGAVNCVGSLLLKPAHSTSPEEWEQTLATNLGSAFATVRAATSAMKSDGGSIVLLSSAAAEVGLVNHEAISAAKAGIIGLARAASASYANRGIRINCVAPGMVRTPLTAHITDNEMALKGSVAMHPLGRIGEADDIAAAIAFLLQPSQNWITGQVLGVDGGLAHVRTRARV
ncbi:MAG: 3-oxoacyl-[acyl-carrier protein] reductase [Planctomycetota bacterium]